MEMKRAVVLITIFLSVLHVAYAQQLPDLLNFNWSGTIRSTDLKCGFIYKQDIAVDSKKNAYVVGHLFGNYDFDPSQDTAYLASAGEFAMFITSYDSLGNYRFAFLSEGSGTSSISSITIDDEDNILVTGTYNDTIDLDPSAGVHQFISNNQKSDIFLAKYRSNGVLVYAKSLGGPDNDGGVSITHDTERNSYLLSQIKDTVDMDPGPGVALYELDSNRTFYVITKFDSSGNYVNSFSLKKFNSSSILHMEVDQLQQVYVAGNFKDTLDVDPGPDDYILYSRNDHNYFIAKYSSSFQFLKAHQFESRGDDYIYTIALDDSANLYVAGELSDFVDADPGPDTLSLVAGHNLQRAFWAKYDSSLNLVNGFCLDELEPTKYMRIAVDKEQSTFLSIMFKGTIDFDPSASNYALVSNSPFVEVIAIAKYDSLGNFLSAKTIGSNPRQSNVLPIVVTNLDTEGSIYLASTYIDSTDFDPGAGSSILTSAAPGYAFIAKYDNDIRYKWVKGLGQFVNSLYPESLRSFVKDSVGNIYIMGGFYGNIDIDPDPNNVNMLTSNGGQDVFVAKFNSSGALISARSFGGKYDDAPGDIVVDVRQHVYIMANFNDSVDIDVTTGIVNVTTSAYFSTALSLAEYDSSWQLIRNIQIGYDDAVSGLKLRQNERKELFIYAFCANGPVDLNPLGTPYMHSGYLSNILARYDSTFLLLNAVKIQGALNDHIKMELGTNGGVYLSGSYKTRITLDSVNSLQVSNGGSTDIFMARYDSLLNLEFGNVLSSTKADKLNDMVLDADDNIYILGYQIADIDMDPSAGVNLLSTNRFATYFAKYNSDGEILFAKQIKDLGSSSNLAVDSEQNIFVTGQVYDTVDLNTISGNPKLFAAQSVRELFVARYNARGGYVDAVTFGDDGTTGPFKTHLDAQNNLTLAGIYLDKTNLDLDRLPSNELIGINDSEIFMASYTVPYHLSTYCNAAISSSFDTLSMCEGDTAIINGVPRLLAGTYIDTLASYLGCDSIATVVLIVHPVVTNSTTISVCTGDSALIYGDWINTAGTYYDTIASSFGCDSMLVTELIINSHKLVRRSNRACGSYISPSGRYVWTTSGSKYDTVQAFNGCDSVININLTIYDTRDTFYTVASCGPIVSQSGNQIWNSSGTYADTIIESSSCLLISEVTLYIVPLSTSVQYTDTFLQADQATALYQWLDCNNNYAVIPGATQRTFVPVVSGNYAVELTHSGCIDTSTCNQIAIVGVNELALSEMISVYPNPTSNNITIDLGGRLNGVTLTIRNIVGQIVSSQYYTSTDRIDTEILSGTGVYLIELSTADGKKAMLKVVKQ